MVWLYSFRVRGDVVQCRVKLRLQVVLAEVEGHAVRQVELDDIAVAGHFYAGAGSLATQLSFLTILVRADGTTGKTTNAPRPHQGALATFSKASPPLSKPATAPMPAPINAPVRVRFGSFGSVVWPV